MSQESFKDFMSKLGSDASLGGAFVERFGCGEHEVPANDVIAFAGEHGYRFSVDEVSGELSDDELDGVAGGASFWNVAGVVAPTDSKPTMIKLDFSPSTSSFRFLKF